MAIAREFWLICLPVFCVEVFPASKVCSYGGERVGREQEFLNVREIHQETPHCRVNCVQSIARTARYHHLVISLTLLRPRQMTLAFDRGGLLEAGDALDRGIQRFRVDRLDQVFQETRFLGVRQVGIGTKAAHGDAAQSIFGV